MKTKIAIIGSESFCRRAEEFTEHRPDISLELYPYEVPEQSPGLLKKLRPCDAILFSGSLPYMAAEGALKTIPVPAVYMKQDETEIAATLLSIALHRRIPLSGLSIDVRDKTVLENVLTASAPSEVWPAVHVLDEKYRLEDIVAFHADALKSGCARLAVTSVHAAYDRLVSSGLPAVKMINVKSSFLKAVDALCQEALYQKSETTKAAVGILQADSRLTDSGDIVNRLARLLHAHHFDNGDGALLYTTQGAIRAAVQLPEFQQTARSAEGMLAFGIGHTLTAAKENAESALGYMKVEHPDGLYLLDDKKNLRNLYKIGGDAIELRVTGTALTEIAEQTALSPAVLSKLTSFGQNQNTLQFTANDLADYLGVSRRTAERTIKKLLPFEYIRTIGEEMTYRQGRPRAVYELNFPVY
ncbi:HTH domain-containing protein [Sporosarcina koreensis]|uniref:HTH domain-containing protein n=1 Tax=Sporosarcina koreensis TaxID=334735 RepID=UPI00058F77C3|nr:HTH domain-containing protein [Sporosarcina koreensis]